MKQYEYEEQKALFRWARLKTTIAKYPGIQLLEGSLNGVHLSKVQAAKAKAAGLLKGSHDVSLPVARKCFNGLSIEMKYGKNKPTIEQIWYGDMLVKEGWRVEYCWSFEEARKVIEEYLDA